MAIFNWNRQPRPRQPLGTTLGGGYGSLRGMFRGLNLGQFGKDFRAAADIPEDARLWTPGRGLRLGALPTNVHETVYSVNPNAAGLNAANGFGGLGDTYQFAADSPYASLNGVSRQSLIDALKQDGVSPAGFSKEQLDAASRLGDISASKGAVIGQTGGEGVGLGDLANLASVLIQGGRAVSTGIQAGNNSADLSQTMRDIRNSTYANPIAGQYLTADQRRLLNQAKHGNTGNEQLGGAMKGVGEGIPKALLAGLLGYATGGAPGAAINAIGTLGNSALSGWNGAIQDTNSKYQSLYSALQNAELEYNNQANSRTRNRYFNFMY